MDSIKNVLNNAKKSIISLTPYGTEKFINSSNEFFNSNTLIAKTTFLLLVIILFVFLFFLFSSIIIYILTPPKNPFLIKGMKDATKPLVIKQAPNTKNSVTIYRSKNEYDGVEFTYSFWLYLNSTIRESYSRYLHVFNKGSIQNEPNMGINRPNNAPGVYLNYDISNSSINMLIVLNIFPDTKHFRYYEDINIDNIPVEKWVCVILRLTSQNIVDVYINGVLTKRHKLTNIVKQNYDNVYVNYNGGFDGYVSNLKYYNYAIGTYEVYKITSNGPDLTMSENTNIKKSKPYYLSSSWYS